MKTRIDKAQNETGNLTNSKQDEFNFELWAKQVRPQLLASVQKRGMR